MKIETLKERLENAKAKIEKKENTITKKKALIEKKENQIRKFGFEPTDDQREVANKSKEAFWLMIDIESLEDEIERGRKEIKETKKTVEKYEQQLAGEIEREAILLKDIPESVKQMQTELVERWDTWDIERRDRMKADYKELGWKAYCEKYRYTNKQFKDKTDEQIHNSNVQDAKCLILDLYYRVRKITGEITSWSGIRACQGTMGMTVLNGYIEGKEGRAEVESILAGGYNIQRLHIRVLVKEYK